MEFILHILPAATGPSILTFDLLGSERPGAKCSNTCHSILHRHSSLEKRRAHFLLCAQLPHVHFCNSSCFPIGMTATACYFPAIQPTLYSGGTQPLIKGPNLARHDLTFRIWVLVSWIPGHPLSPCLKASNKLLTVAGPCSSSCDQGVNQ